MTQLFSYIIGLSIQYGYVYTGKAFIFMHIPTNDPTTILYYVYIPVLDVAAKDGKSRLHRTAVAQVLAIILQSVHTTPPNTA